MPAPSARRRGQYLVAPDETLALKLALHQALADRKMTAADLVRGGGRATSTSIAIETGETQ